MTKVQDVMSRDVFTVKPETRRRPLQVLVDALTGDVVTPEGTVLHPSDVPVVEALARRIDGVVAVESHLQARAPEPTLP